ncbi:hypothetical protein [Selenihalanaerobacter shriftii]|uniref:Uncharacterized protein n=1 Tax=Selenihalanaerobacter shriftii TaxID=142842 RepID=A0A1T4K616_9FIRM|nr:hypothetical protein [Selenihalanaerobacter shriftii]SJZ37852.1 hypothetical protein SAMN02745118_00633 [Selenihalanaerobacter shriftii]
MIKTLTNLLKRIRFKHEIMNLFSFFIGMFSSSAMVSFIIYGSLEWAIISGIVGWIGFSVLFKRYEKVIYKEITIKLLKNCDHNKVKDVLEIIHE